MIIGGQTPRREPGGTHLVQAGEHFDRAIANALYRLTVGTPETAAIVLMRDLLQHPGTYLILDARRQGDLLLAVFAGPAETRRYIENIPGPESEQDEQG